MSLSAQLPVPVPPAIPDYELLRPIGRGSYGEVWLARGITGVYRAIKVVWRDRFANAEPFEREFHGVSEFTALPADGRTQLALLHVGRNDEAHFFYTVMELADDAVRGRDIDPTRYVPLTLAEARKRGGRLPAASCLGFGVELARALAALHAHGLVHRDIKPSNIILVAGIPKLADVGLVSHAGTAVSFVGTQGFVPPEGPGTPAGDVYALGKVLYEISTGFDSAQFPQLPPDLREQADGRGVLKLNRVVLQACEPDPRRRYRDASAMLTDLLALENGRRRRRIGASFLVVTAVLVVAGLALGWRQIATYRARRGEAWTMFPASIPNPDRVPVAPAAQAVAVLPLAYLGSDPEKAYFADGMHAELIATLGRIPELRVVPRESVRAFRDSNESLPSIGRRLGVGNVMTGTVRCSSDAIRIQLELRRAADEALLWFQSYDREYRAVISVQTAVAEDVARVLRARATGGGAAAAKFLTTNPEAYERLLKATVLIDSAQGPERKQALEQAIVLLEEALRLDPNFMPAANQLSQAHVILVTNYERDAARMVAHAAAGRRWGERASELMPGGAGETALAYYYANIEQDNVRAGLLALRAVRASPNSSGPYALFANAVSGVGHPDVAAQWTGRAIELNPSAIVVRGNLLMQLAAARRKEDWRAALAQYLAVAERGESQGWAIPLSRFRVLGQLPSDGERKSLVAKWQTEFLWDGRRFAEALAAADRSLGDERLGDLDRFELQYWRSEILRRLDRPAEAALAARANLALAERLQAIAEVDPTEKDERMARAFAGVRQFDEAIKAARHAIDTLPVPAQQTRRWRREGVLAMILADANRPGEACDLLAKLLRVPSWLTVPMLRVDPRWDKLRADKRFQTLLDDPANDVPFGKPLNRTARAVSPPRS